jgi:HK97 family phage prohead protease
MTKQTKTPITLPHGVAIKRLMVPLTDLKLGSLNAEDPNDAGTITGYASVYGNVDDQMDIVQSGAFGPALAKFLKEGFLSDAHDWSKPIAYPTSAKEDDFGLLIGARFHTTQAAQDLRTIASERIAAGLTMGLSVGFTVGDYEMRKDGVRVIKTADILYEVAFCLVPANGSAVLTGIKGSDGLLAPDTFLNETERVLASVLVLSSRAAAIGDFRAKQGRVLSEANRQRLLAVADAAESAVDELRQLLEDSADDQGEEDPTPKGKNKADPPPEGGCGAEACSTSCCQDTTCYDTCCAASSCGTDCCLSKSQNRERALTAWLRAQVVLASD